MPHCHQLNKHWPFPSSYSLSVFPALTFCAESSLPSIIPRTLGNLLSTARHAPTSTSIANAAHASPRSSRQLSTVQKAKRRLFKIYQTSAHQPPNASAPHLPLIQTCQSQNGLSANTHTDPSLSRTAASSLTPSTLLECIPNRLVTPVHPFWMFAFRSSCV